MRNMKRGFCFVLMLFLMGFTELTDKNYLLGKFNPSSDARFTVLNNEHTSASARGGYLRTDVYEAFVKMSVSAAKDDIKLIIISATRNFESQKQIWENKWNGRTLVEGKNLTTIKDPGARAEIILRFSSMPGTSRHHWGTDMDLNSLVNSYFESGHGLKIYQWLQAHAGAFGFCQPYTSKAGGRTGYEEEKWHWSYYPVSKELLGHYVQQVKYDDITGFDGADAALGLGIIENYVQGIGCQE